MSDELKIVIALKGAVASVGVQAPNCDPVFSMHQGDLPAVLQMVPAMVEEAHRRWDSNPRYPKCETKLEPPPSTVRVTTPPQVSTQAQDIRQRLPF
jgi:hypothetical protein